MSYILRMVVISAITLSIASPSFCQDVDSIQWSRKKVEEHILTLQLINRVLTSGMAKGFTETQPEEEMLFCTSILMAHHGLSQQVSAFSERIYAFSPENSDELETELSLEKLKELTSEQWIKVKKSYDNLESIDTKPCPAYSEAMKIARKQMADELAILVKFYK